MSSRGVAEMVRGVLGGDLDPDVRGLAVERLESSLLRCAAEVLGAGRDLVVTLSPDDGTVRVAERAPGGDGGDGLRDVSADEDVLRRLRARLDRELIAGLAPAVGAARAAVKAGERALPRARPPRAPKPPAAPPKDPVALLARVVLLQQRRIDALAAALRRAGADAAEDDEVAQELRRLLRSLGGPPEG